jgi:hypothetical protein
VRWLVVSLVLSVVLTVALNVGLRAFPGAGERMARRLGELATQRDDRRGDGRRVRVDAPWRAMIVASIVLTLVLDLLLALR